MSDELRRYLADRNDDLTRANRFLDGLPEPDDDLGDLLLDARIDAAEHLEGESASALWLVRLSGESIQDGWIDTDMQQRVVGALGREVEAAAGHAADEAKIGLVGVSSGSVVLHFRPRIPTLAARDDQLPYDVSAADAAIERVSELHDMIESGTPAATIASAFKGDKELLNRARVLVESLNTFGVNLSTRWWSSDSRRRRRSGLSEQGRGYAAELFAKSLHASRVRLAGMVTGLSLDGIVTLRSIGGRKNARATEVAVPEDLVRAGGFGLGEVVHIDVRVEREVDRVGGQGAQRYIYIQHVERQELT